MQRLDSAATRTGGFGTTLLLWLLCAVLILAIFALAVDTLVPKIEDDLRFRSAQALSGTGITEANIEVDGQDVFLKGEIDSSPLREEAGKIVQSVIGVRTVSNSLNLANAVAQTTNTDAQDNDRTKATAQPPSSEPNTAKLEITVADARPTVLGTLANQGDIDRVTAALNGKYGADKLDNQLQIDANARPLWLDGAIAMIDQFDNIQNPGMLISDNVVRLAGDVSSETLGAQKIAMAKRLFGSEMQVQSGVSIRQSKPASRVTTATDETSKRPGSLKLADTGGRQILSGVVGSQEELGAVIKSAQDIYKPSALEIAITVDESVGPIPWADSLFKVAADLKDVDNLGLSVNSGQLVLSGDVDSRDVADSIKASVRQEMGDTLDVIDTFNIPTGPAESVSTTDLKPANAQAEQSAAGTLTAPRPEPILPTTDDQEEAQRRQLAARLNDIDLSQIRFERGSSVLTDDAKAALETVATTILDYSQPAVEIAGHTDSLGNAFTNLELSKQRADAVRQYLIEQNVPARQIRAIGYGETKPIGDNGTPAGRAANRRIEINL